METSFIDDSVDINAGNYIYKITVINDCNLTGIDGYEGSSVFLHGNWRNYRTSLFWTPYMRWQYDVDHYTIEKQNINGVWERILDVYNETQAEIRE
jgi:hypothetical protein